MESSASRQQGPGIYPRGGEEFARVLAFSDGVFAIAMTLLVVSVELPDLSSPDVSELANALADLETGIFTFFLSFVVIGFYWLAHHRFVASLAAMNRGLIIINLAYLSLIAFMPFPTDVLGNYPSNGLSIAFYAVVVCLISGLETVQFRHAYRHDLLTKSPPRDVYRWVLLESTIPLLPFVASIPLAFASTAAAMYLWIAAIPLGKAIQSRRPARAEELIGG